MPTYDHKKIVYWDYTKPLYNIFMLHFTPQTPILDSRIFWYRKFTKWTSRYQRKLSEGVYRRPSLKSPNIFPVAYFYSLDLKISEKELFMAKLFMRKLKGRGDFIDMRYRIRKLVFSLIEVQKNLFSP